MQSNSIRAAKTSHDRRWPMAALGVLLVVPFFIDIGPSGIGMGSGVFEQTSRSLTQTIPIGVFVVAGVTLAVVVGGLIRGGIRILGPKSVWLLIVVYIMWLFFVVAASPYSSQISLAYLFQALIPFCGYVTGLWAGRTDENIIPFVRGILLGLGLTAWFHLSAVMYDVGFEGIVGTRLLTEAWGLNIYQAYNYYPLVIALALVVIISVWRYSSDVRLRPVRHWILVIVPSIALILMLGARGPVGAGIVGLLVVGFVKSWRSRRSFVRFHTSMFVLATFSVGVVVYLGTREEIELGLVALERLYATLTTGNVESALGVRWRIFVDAFDVLSTNIEILLVGTGLTPPQEVVGTTWFGWSSAHNYYIDLALWTGGVGLAVMVCLLVMVTYNLWKEWELAYWGTPRAAVVIAALGVLGGVCLVSNNLRVPLRQPYSGVFIWTIIGVGLGRRGLGHSRDVG